MIDDAGTGSPDGAADRPLLHAVWHWDGVGLEIAIAELPGVAILVPTLADAPLAVRKRIIGNLGSRTQISTSSCARPTEFGRHRPADGRDW